MIVRAKTPKGLSWAGRLVVMGAAALLLPLAPSWAQKDDPKPPPAGLDRLIAVNNSKASADLTLSWDQDQRGPQTKGAELLDALIDHLERQIQAGLNGEDLHSEAQLEDRVKEEFLKDPEVLVLIRELSDTKEQLDRAKAMALLPADPARLATVKKHKRLTEQYAELWFRKHDEIRARLSTDDEKDNGGKKEKSRDTAERIEKQVKDLIDKLGKELGPVGEEIRKALEQAVREVHQSLEKEGVSVEELRRSVEKAHEKLRGAVDQGGPVNEEMGKAMERSRKEMRESLERAREDLRGAMRERLEAVRERQRELAKKDQPESERRNEAQAGRERAEADRSERERLRADSEKSAAKDGEGQPNREDLDTARKEIRELEQQLRRATRRLEQLQRRESLRNTAPRRPGNPRGETAPPRDPTAPRGETAPTPRSPAAPATSARPTTPHGRQPQRPNGPAARGGGGQGAPQPDYEQRFRELDDKLNRLLKELEKMKDEKKPNETGEPSARVTRPAKPGVAAPF